MARKIKKYIKHNWRVVRDAFIMRNDMPSLRKVAREYKVDSGQISKRSRREKWEKQKKRYWDKVSAKVQQKSAAITVFDHVQAVKITAGLVGVLLEKIKNKDYDQDDKLSGLISSYDKMARLNELLQGRPDGKEGSLTFEDFVKELMKKRVKEHRQIEADDRNEKLRKVKAKVKDDAKDSGQV